MPKKESRLQEWLPLGWAAMLCAMAATLYAFVEVYLIHFNLRLYDLLTVVLALEMLALTALTLPLQEKRLSLKGLLLRAAISAVVYGLAFKGSGEIVYRFIFHGTGQSAIVSTALYVAITIAQVAVLAVLGLFAQGKQGRRAQAVFAALVILAAYGFTGLRLAPKAAPYFHSKIEYAFALSTEKFRREDNLPKRGEMRVVLGKNEREAFQFLLRNGSAEMFRLELGEFTGPGGTVLPATVYQEAYTYVGVTGQEGLYPDALLPYGGGTVHVPPRSSQGFYIELRSTADTSAGVYTAPLTVLNFDYNRPEEVIVQTEITAEVLDVTFPDAATSDTAIGMWGGWMYERNGVDYDSPEGEALRKAYYDYLLDHKISAYETLPYDILDPRADAYMGDPRVKSFKIPYPWEDDEKLLEYYNKVQSDPAWAAKAFFYEVDEPDNADKVNRYMEMTERLERLCPGYNMVTPFYTWQFSDGGGDYDNLAFQDGRSNIICPLSELFDNPGFGEAYQKRASEEGAKAWWYICCGPGEPYVNQYIHYQGTRPRLLFWQQYQRGITGLLYWNSVFWEQTDPWMSSATYRTYEASGDGCWLYPGAVYGQDGPVPSLRLKNLADGLEDYDLLSMAEEVYGRDWVLEWADKLSRSLTSYTHDAQAMDAVRVELLRALEGQAR